MFGATVETVPMSTIARILLVEDDAIIRLTMAETLRDLGAVVVEAASADEAWNYIVAGGMVDLVFTDHQLPGTMTGAQFAQRLKRHSPRLPVVLTSGSFNDPERPEPVLDKPYHMSEVAAELIRRAISGPGEGQ